VHISHQLFTVKKRVPLTISRGTQAASTNLWLKVTDRAIHPDLEGWGEAVPFSIGTHHQSLEQLTAAVEPLAARLAPLHPAERQKIDRVLQTHRFPSALCAALDVALWDWWGKQQQQPLWQLWGWDLGQITPTSVTIGISSPSAAQQRLQDWLQRTSAQAVKVKLGNPRGIAADKAMFQAIYDQTPPTVSLSVDANGGWDLETALQMADWLAARRVTHLEQPLPVAHDHHLQKLKAHSPLPIFVDESCFSSGDIPRLMDRVDGINIKLMKAGGLSEGLKMIHTARACGLQVMFGCYSDSTLANTAMAHLSPLADYLDLDSHLNLEEDPFTGATLQNGKLIPPDHPGLGLTHPVIDPPCT
jgi:L-alanine-DL-glutamate epimerase-like enolase superfamily enzyme